MQSSSAAVDRPGAGDCPADTLARSLDGPRARGAFLLRSVLAPPWSRRIQDGAPLSLVTLLRGTAWIGSAELRPGDVALVRGPEPYTVADTPGTPCRWWPTGRCPSEDCRSRVTRSAGRAEP
ncbi:cupin domain-containing protein [Streptomyces olivaceoviridis]|uniref:cupin domain-containing protein n=1 Tax=Streptomyces olivaceoviridis TaxID=1921 RepID=UPI00368FF22D